MPYKIKVFKKSGPPNEAQLLSGMERIMFHLEHHRVAILIGVLMLVLVAAVVGVVIWYDYRQAEEAVELERQAARLYFDRPVDEPEKARTRLKEAISQYRQLVEQYPRSPSAQLGLYRLGNALVESNELVGAIEAYKNYIATYRANQIVLGLVSQRLGYAYLLSGDHEQAAKAFSDVLALPGALNKDHALLELGKLEEARSRPEGALSHYQDLTKLYPHSPFAGEAGIRIKALGAKMGPEDGASSQGSEESPPQASEGNKQAPSEEP
ncbi:MAG: tol-pal system YbgF family protein [Nitrospiraceae bacterium]